jgi:hypothetical protein
MGTKVNLRHENLIHAYLDWQIVLQAEQLTLEYGRCKLFRTQGIAMRSTAYAYN